MDQERPEWATHCECELIHPLKGIKSDRFQTDSIVDVTRDQLRNIERFRKHDDPKVMIDLRKRKLIVMGKAISYVISRGPKYAREIVKEETDLTYEMLIKYVSPTITH